MLNACPNILVIDIGNSMIKLTCFAGENMSCMLRVPTPGNDDEDPELIRHGLTEIVFNNQPINGVIVSSVVPYVNPVLEGLLRDILKNGDENIVWLTSETLDKFHPENIDLSQYAPNMLGADRLANVAAAGQLFKGKNIIVVDLGTTTTFDMIDSSSVFIGGAICPGPRRFQSLVGQAAQLFEVDLFIKPSQTPGLSTQTSLENGLYYGYKGLLEGIIENLFIQVDWSLNDSHILFTGGFAEEAHRMMSPEFSSYITVDASFTLKGIYCLWQQNMAHKPIKMVKNCKTVC